MSTKLLIMPMIEEEINKTYDNCAYNKGYLAALKKIAGYFNGIGVKVVTSRFPEDLQEGSDG